MLKTIFCKEQRNTLVCGWNFGYGNTSAVPFFLHWDKPIMMECICTILFMVTFSNGCCAYTFILYIQVKVYTAYTNI
jgi:hypothetical protein